MGLTKVNGLALFFPSFLLIIFCLLKSNGKLQRVTSVCWDEFNNNLRFHFILQYSVSTAFNYPIAIPNSLCKRLLKTNAADLMKQFIRVHTMYHIVSEKQGNKNQLILYCGGMK